MHVTFPRYINFEWERRLDFLMFSSSWLSDGLFPFLTPEPYSPEGSADN
jgi:hypothetical protein